MNEDPHLVNLHTSDMWVQVYDLPNGFISENIFTNIGNFVGKFVKSDPSNLSEGWRMYARVRVTMDLDKPLKRRMKIKIEGGEWSWVNFKYERLSNFCFVCGIISHSDRDYSLVYANPEREIPPAYGTWLRAPTRNMNSQNLGAKWLRNGYGGNKAWEETVGGSKVETTVQGRDRVEERFKEVDGQISEISGNDGGIKIVQKNQGSENRDNNFLIQTDGSA